MASATTWRQVAQEAATAAAKVGFTAADGDVVSFLAGYLTATPLRGVEPCAAIGLAFDLFHEGLPK